MMRGVMSKLVTGRYLSRWRMDYISTLMYMLQVVEYDVRAYLGWNRRVSDYGSVVKRQELDRTKKVKLLYWWMVGFEVIVLAMIVASIFVWGDAQASLIRIAVLALLPVMMEYVVLVPLVLGDLFVKRPIERKRVAEAARELRAHKGYKIAIAGSYGKTTAKEVLRTVIGAGKKVAASPGNINQPLGLAKFIMGLDGDEDVLIFELGEYRTGDVYEMCKLVQPDTGVITGVSGAHLETFRTIRNITNTVFGVKKYVGSKRVYLDGDNELVRKRAKKEDVVYSEKGVGEMKVVNVETGLFGTSFELKDARKNLKVETQLLGEHNVAVAALSVYIARELGVSEKDIVRGLEEVRPFEHRMQPRNIGGAVVIDDTYNGNLEGVKAGVRFLKGVEGRKIYVTPGLVEQGKKTKEIHEEIGGLLAKGIDKVVLMDNSVAQFIKAGLDKGKFKGELVMMEEPLEFYKNLEKFVAAGDVVLMQNDWTDNYS